MLTNHQLAVLWILTGLSFVLVLYPFLYYFIEGFVQQRLYKEKKAKPFGRKLLLFSFCVIMSITALYLAIGYLKHCQNAADAPAAFLDNLYHSLISAFQIFNAESTDLSTAALAEALASGKWCFARFLLLFSYFLRLAAPIAGGAIFLEALTEIFPSVKHRIAVFNRHYYFSELNERSLALASSWYKEVTQADKEELNELCSFGEKGKKRREGMTFAEWIAAFVKALIYRVCKPVIIFTDAYHDSEIERSAEIYLRAKSMGAICLRCDISDIKCYRLPFKRHFFLIDENEIDNIKTFATLTDDRHMSILKRAEVYIFYQNDSYVLTEKNTIESLKDKYIRKYENKYIRAYKKYCRIQARSDISGAYNSLKKKDKNAPVTKEQIKDKCTQVWNKAGKKKLSEVYGKKEAEEMIKSDQGLLKKAAEDAVYKKICQNASDALLPQVTRIRCYQNLIFNLLDDIPLYIPLTNKERKGGEQREYNITILGNGETGSQMLRACTWCGQLYGYTPCINLLSVDTPEAVAKQISSKCPELLESAREKSDCLRIFSDESVNEYSPVYCRIRCAQADVEREPLPKMVFTDLNDDTNTHSITDSDYYLVALGSDELNIQIAEQLGTMLKAEQALGRRKNDKIVIVLAIYDTNLRKMFNLKNGERNSFILSREGGVLVEAFGSLEQAYSRKNITMDKHLALSRTFDKMHKKGMDDLAKGRMRERYDKTYESWSGIARSVHRKYRMFSAFTYMKDNGLWKERAPEKWSDFTDMDYDYYCTVHGPSEENAPEEKTAGSSEYPCASDRERVASCLGWLEHRRWNAYIRSEGFACRSDGGEKKIDLKLHPCLVECKIEPAKDYYVGEKEHLANKKDKLDEISDLLYGGMAKSYDMPADADKDFISRYSSVKGTDENTVVRLYPALVEAYIQRLESLWEEKKQSR